MKPLTSAVRRLSCLILAALVWASSGAAVLAATEPDKPAKGGSGQWLMCYAVVLLFVALGLMMLVRPSGRRDRPKMEQ